jgi:hypothetical protein
MGGDGMGGELCVLDLVVVDLAVETDDHRPHILPHKPRRRRQRASEQRIQRETAYSERPRTDGWAGRVQMQAGGRSAGGEKRRAGCTADVRASRGWRALRLRLWLRLWLWLRYGWLLRLRLTCGCGVRAAVSRRARASRGGGSGGWSMRDLVARQRADGACEQGV